MAIVLVHGVPDTPRLWNPVRARLERDDVHTPALPGFGCDVPPGFDATKEAYVDWLIRELEAVGGPVDLVGHDWGSLLVQRVVSLRPDLIRTWACGSGFVDRDWTWHPTAQQWQTPDVGEALMAATTPEMMAAALAGAGIPADEAAAVAASVDARMKDCILRLYRSAVEVGAEWHDAVDAIGRPGLVFAGEADPFVEPAYGAKLARR
jgi:pimeloyl-ACP methyl ester carboxylesterase